MNLRYNIIVISITASTPDPYKHARLSPIWVDTTVTSSPVSVLLSTLALKFYKDNVRNLANKDSSSPVAGEDKYS